jgi:hypothetical protein
MNWMACDVEASFVPMADDIYDRHLAQLHRERET